jgi:hypothetical protein
MAQYTDYFSKMARGPAFALALGGAVVSTTMMIDAETSPLEACTLTTYKHPNKPLTGLAKGKRFLYYQGFEWTTSPDPKRRRHIKYNGTTYHVQDTAKSAWEACVKLAPDFLRDTNGRKVKIKLDGCDYDRNDLALRENKEYCGKTETIGDGGGRSAQVNIGNGGVIRQNNPYR